MLKSMSFILSFLGAATLGAVEPTVVDDPLYNRILALSQEVFHWSEHHIDEQMELWGKGFWGKVRSQDVRQDDLEFLAQTLGTNLPNLGALKEEKIEHIFPLCFSSIAVYYTDPPAPEMITNVQTVMAFYAHAWMRHLTHGRCDIGTLPWSTAGIAPFKTEGLSDDQVSLLDGRLEQIAEDFLQTLESQASFQKNAAVSLARIFILMSVIIG